MPTGYTAKLMEHGQSFQEFAMICARAFGACIEMRDDPMDAPIPEKFEPSPFYTDAVAASRKEARRLQSMTASEKIQFGADKKAEALKSLRDCLAREREQNVRLRKMELEVLSWQPPTSEHEDFKKFMLNQISISRHDSDGYWAESIDRATSKGLSEYWADALKAELESISRNEEESEKEKTRAESRTRWIKQLRDSLKEREGIAA